MNENTRNREREINQTDKTNPREDKEVKVKSLLTPSEETTEQWCWSQRLLNGRDLQSLLQGLEAVIAEPEGV